MSIKVINNDQAPSRKNRHSGIYDLPEWGEVIDNLATEAVKVHARTAS